MSQYADMERKVIEIDRLRQALRGLIDAASCYFEQAGHHDPESVPCIVAAKAALNAPDREG